jgi:PAS domain S-box-containing protein
MTEIYFQANHNSLKILDSRFHGNDENTLPATFYESVIVTMGQKMKSRQASAKNPETDLDTLQSRLATLEQEQTRLREELAVIQGERDQYRDLIENANDIMYVIDAEGYFTQVNRAAEKIVGYSREELVGRHYLTLIRPDYQDIADRTYSKQRVYQISDTYFEFPAITKDGREIWIGQYVQAIITGDTLQGFRAVARDVTKQKRIEEGWKKYQEQLESMVEARTFELKKKNQVLEFEIFEKKQTETALLASEEKYRSILETIEEGYYEVDLRGNFTFFNEVITRICGYPRAELMGMNNRQYTDAENARKLYQSFNEVYQTGIPSKSCEYEIIDSKGRRKILESSVSLIRDSSGKLIGFRGIVREISELKQAQRALKESEERYRTIIETIEDGYFEADLTGRLTFFNDALARIHEYPRAEFMGKQGREYADTENARLLYLGFTGVYRTGQSLKGLQYEVMTKTGRKRNVETSVSLIRDPSGKPSGFRGIVRDITDRKRDEVLLKDSEERFKAQYQQNPLPTVTWQRQGENFILIDCNQAAITASKGKVADLIGKTAGELYKRRPDLLHKYERCFWDQTVITDEIVSEFFLPGRNIVTTLAYIPPDLLLLHFRDITERIRMAEALKEQLNFLQQLLEITPLPLYYKDIEGVFQGCNKAFEELVGLTKAQVIGKTAYEVYPKDLADIFFQADSKLFAQPGVQVYEASISHADGDRREVIFNKATFTDSAGRVAGLIGAILDITDRKRAEEVLTENHSRIALLLNSISSILIAISEDNRIVFWNTFAEKEFGIEREAAVGKVLNQIDIHWDWEKIIDGISRCRMEHTSVGIEQMNFMQQAGKEGLLGLRITPISGDESLGLVVLIQGANITRRKILESQLAQAQKMESIGQLAAGIAHEINTPTQYVGDNVRFLQTAFADFLEVLRQYEMIREEAKGEKVIGNLFEKVKEVIEKADLGYLIEETPKAFLQTLDGIDRVSRIVKSIKAFAHPGKEEKTLIDLNKAVENTVLVSKNEWKYVADVVTELDPSLALVPCIPGDINQVLLNILVNAAHAVAEVVGDGAGGKGTITIATGQRDSFAEIRISDTGKGIPEAIRSKIFDPFFTTKEVGKGTGQGLAICHTAIVERHQGGLSFDTEIGKGTTFFIQLPLEEGGRSDAKI